MWGNYNLKPYNKKYFDYDTETTLENRIEETSRMLKKNPHNVPVLIEYKGIDKSIKMDRCKFSVPNNKEMFIVMAHVKQRLKIDASSALFFFIGNTIPNINQTLGELYENYKSEDGFLRIMYTKENTFG
jgi:GABA(A) receptor-associated protein